MDNEYNLFLDDVRIPKDIYNFINFKWTIVRSYKEFVEIITRNGLPSLISFDHDLADDHYKQLKDIDYSKYKEKTGLHCAKWLIDYCLDNSLKLPTCLVHSANPAGRQNINSILDNFKKFQENKA